MNTTKGYLHTKELSECFGCEACAQVCAKQAITMKEDPEGFRYPFVDPVQCVGCGLCNQVCPVENSPNCNNFHPYTYGGHINNTKELSESTSGGAFTAIAKTFAAAGNYVIFGATSDGLNVYHTYIDDILKLSLLRKSKYSQSIIGDSYKKVKDFLQKGTWVLFSGTPCQIAALRSYLGKVDISQLLTVEVICEGVPSPLYVRKLNNHIIKKYGSPISLIDYRCKTSGGAGPRKWDFEVMQIDVAYRNLYIDRWFNPFWSIWLNHLISRPSCYECPFANTNRVADISLGDLWGVHLYCPELYNRNKGCSLIVSNTEKGEKLVRLAERLMSGHELRFEEALRYQAPMRNHISKNPRRAECMDDLKSEIIEYEDFVRKWNVRPTLKLLFQKYFWGNRQKVFLWNALRLFK